MNKNLLGWILYKKTSNLIKEEDYEIKSTRSQPIKTG